MSISRAFFCNIRNIYLRTNISSDKYSSSEKYLFWEIFIWRNICFENICFFNWSKIFVFQEIFILRNIYSEKYLFRKYFFLTGCIYNFLLGAFFYSSYHSTCEIYNLYHGPGNCSVRWIVICSAGQINAKQLFFLKIQQQTFS